MAALAQRLKITGLAICLCLAAGTATADVVVVVSSDSPLQALSRDMLADLYLGRLDHLPDSGKVVPIDLSERAPAHDEFYREYLDRTPAEIKAHWSRLIFTGRGQPPESVRDGETMADVVAKNRNAVGYVDSSLVNERLRVVAIE